MHAACIETVMWLHIEDNHRTVKSCRLVETFNFHMGWDHVSLLRNKRVGSAHSETWSRLWCLLMLVQCHFVCLSTFFFIKCSLLFQSNCMLLEKKNNTGQCKLGNSFVFKYIQLQCTGSFRSKNAEQWLNERNKEKCDRCWQSVMMCVCEGDCDCFTAGDAKSPSQ